MVLRATRQQSNVRKNARNYFSQNRFFVSVYIFWGTLVVSALSFVSLTAAILAFSCFSLGLCILYENRRRQYWETANSFKISDIEQKYHDLSSASQRHTKSIKSLQRNVGELTSALDENLNNEMPFTKKDDESPDMLTARRHRPFTPVIANDDPFGDHKSLSDVVIKQLLQTAVTQKRIDIFAQPIVRLPQRQTVGFEIYARIRAKAGLYVPAGRYMHMAKTANLQHDIDTLLLKECLGILRERETELDNQFFFINIQPDTLKNKKYMVDLLAFVAKNRTLAKKLVFEIRYADYQSLPPQIFQIINGLSRLGCAFSLDHVDDLEFNFKDLIKHNVKYVKIKAGWMATQGKSDMDFTHLWRLKNKMEANGVRIIVDHIEHENALRNLLDFDPHYGQGYLFGKPDLIGAFKPFSYTKTSPKRKGIEEKFA